MKIGLRKFVPVVIFTVLIFFGPSVFASFEFGVSIENDTVFFDSSAIIDGHTYTRSGHVEYEVYHLEEYVGTLDAMPDNHYVYAYQVFNDEASDLSFDTFSVNFVPGVAVENPGSVGTGTDPSGYRSLSGSISYYFDNSVISPGENSSILLFSSLLYPTAGYANINGEGRNSTVELIMVPTPEPASSLLFGIGGACLAFSRRRKGS